MNALEALLSRATDVVEHGMVDDEIREQAEAALAGGLSPVVVRQSQRVRGEIVVCIRPLS